jgi:biotin-(acetyl-CoA carboxylase) ligase
MQSGKKTDRAKVAVLLLQNIIEVLQVYRSEPGFYLEKFRSCYDYCKEKSVEIILDNQEVLTGIAQGINNDAELLVLIDGEQHVFNSAEVSVKAG